jgi:hypothetical protein
LLEHSLTAAAIAALAALLQIKDDWQAFAAALTPLLTPFGPYAAALNTLIVKLAKVIMNFVEIIMAIDLRCVQD